MEEQKSKDAKNMSLDAQVPKVTGIGGIFFFSEDLQKTRDWYTQNLGVEITKRI